VLYNVEKNNDKGRTNSSLLLFGDGDGGGGPQLEHVEHLIRVQDFEGIPKVKFSTCHDFFEEAKATSKKLMTWEGELYLELHNGTYTTMAEHKYYNRYMETLLRDVEFFNYLCELGGSESNHTKIKEMWYTFLIDQFHDVLPGTCTFLTVDDTRENFAALKKTCEEIYQSSIK
jgi:alpha-mannosidase